MPKREEIPLPPSRILHSNAIGKNYLLVIAVDRYRNSIRSLQNAVFDATAIRDCLQHKYQFQDECIELFNEEATRSALITIFDDLIKKITAEDNLVFYFAGHGKLVSTINEGYWLLADACSGKRDTYLSNYEVQKFMRSLKARHVFGIVDSCFSGTLFRGQEAVPSSNLYSYKSRYLLTAGRHEPVDDGLPGEHSPFATCLLELLRNNPYQHFWVGDLCRSVLKNIRFNVDEQTPRGEPLQKVGHQGGEFVFIRKDSNYPIPITKSEPSVFAENINTSSNSIFKRKAKEKILFISYDEADNTLKNEFTNQLINLQYRHNFTILSEDNIPDRVNASKYIKSILDQADIIFLLVSSNFINSKHLQSRDVKIALKRHEKKEVKVIPIYLSPCFWEKMDFAKIQGFPRNNIPISKWSDRDEAWFNIIKSLDTYFVQKS